MGNLSIEIPDEECVKLFRYEDGDGVAAYLLLFPEHDMKRSSRVSMRSLTTRWRCQ
mgnify:CR=1 FL=1